MKEQDGRDPIALSIQEAQIGRRVFFTRLVMLGLLGLVADSPLPESMLILTGPVTVLPNTQVPLNLRTSPQAVRDGMARKDNVSPLKNIYIGEIPLSEIESFVLQSPKVVRGGDKFFDPVTKGIITDSDLWLEIPGLREKTPNIVTGVMNRFQERIFYASLSRITADNFRSQAPLKLARKGPAGWYARGELVVPQNQIGGISDIRKK